MAIMKKFLAVSVPIALGYGVMKTCTPSTEQVLESLPEEQKRSLQKEQRARRYTQSELVGLMLEQNMASSRPAWDVRPPVLPNGHGHHEESSTVAPGRRR